MLANIEESQFFWNILYFYFSTFEELCIKVKLGKEDKSKQDQDKWVIQLISQYVNYTFSWLINMVIN